MTSDMCTSSWNYEHVLDIVLFCCGLETVNYANILQSYTKVTGAIGLLLMTQPRYNVVDQMKLII